MLLSDQYHTIPLDRITVLRDERQRRKFETDDLEKSLQRIGLINPIIVRQEEDKIILVAGERRFTAASRIGWTEITVRYAHELSVIEAAIVELEENIKRKDLSWQDQVMAVAKLHKLHSEADPDWNQGKTAEAISMTDGTISIYLKVFPHMEDPRILECSTVRNAYDVLDRRDSRRKAVARAALLEDDDDEDFDDGGSYEPNHILSSNDIEVSGDKLIIGGKDNGESANGAFEVERVPITIYGDVKPAYRAAQPLDLAESIIHGSFLDWAPTYTKRRFDFIHCDFPYGNEVIGPQMKGNEHEYYEDSPELYLNLLNCFCENLDNILTGTGWVMFWYAGRMEQMTREIIKVKAPSLTVQTHPLIWVHSDNSGITPDHRRRPRHIYDTALLMYRGPEAHILKVKSDAYSSPTDHKLHPSTKPEPMLRYFFEMFIDNYTQVLDPTCGSGAALRAAESLGSPRVMGIEANWDHCEAARGALKESRNKAKILDRMLIEEEEEEDEEEVE